MNNDLGKMLLVPQTIHTIPWQCDRGHKLLVRYGDVVVFVVVAALEDADAHHPLAAYL